MTTSAYSLIPLDRPATVDELVDLYGPVVEHCARHYFKEYYEHRQSLDDLRQDAWIGVLKAWNEYSPDRGMAFRTFAVCMARWWLLNGVRFFDKALFNAWRTDRSLYLTILQVDSLDRIMDELGGHSGFQALDEEPSCTVPFQHLLSMIKSARLRFVVDQYYWHGRTLDDIGIELGVSRERVRQILNEAYVQIRAGLKKKKKNPFATSMP